jgi:hypothetical protein
LLQQTYRMPLGTRTVRAVFAVACVALVAMVAACTPGATAGSPGPAGSPSASATPRVATYDATVTVDASGPILGKTNNHYEGLSFESERLNTGWFDNVGNLSAMLRNLGTSVMRFGGNSVDTSYHGISAPALAGLARLSRASGWTVLYSEPLAHFNAAAVTRDSRAVSNALGGQLAGFACGNEPDLYHTNGLRPATYAESTYLGQVAQCFQAIRAGAPGAMLEGPDFSSAPGWLGPYAAAERGTIGWFGEHEYALGCQLEGDPPAQLADNLLSPALTEKENKFFDSVAAAARRAGAQAHLTETNSTCDGGADGMSNSYATALWVVQYLLNGAEHGIVGMNFHGGLTGGCQYFTPLCRVSGNEFGPMPIYYGMLFAHMFGNGRLLPVNTATGSPVGPTKGPAVGAAVGAAAPNLQAFALRPYSGGLRVLVENLSPYRAATSVNPGASATSASELVMSAPSLLATSGVRVQGAQVAANGTFSPGKATPVACHGGTCRVTIEPYSAVMLTVP